MSETSEGLEDYDMADNKQDQDISLNSDFYDWAGVDHISSPFLVRPNKLWQSVNFNSDQYVGAKSIRPSYAAFLDNPDNQPVRNLIFWTKRNSDGTTTSYLLRISGSHIYSYVVGSGATTWTSIFSGLTNTTAVFAYTVLGYLLHLSNGYDAYMTWDGTTFTTDASAPKARALITYQRRVYAANIPNNDNVYQSSVGYIGAPGEYASITASYAAGVTSITVGNNQAGLNSFAGAASGMWIQAILGSGTANQENVVVTGVTGVSGAWVLTLNAATTKTHTAGDILTNNAPWYSDNNNASSANYFPVDPDYNGQVIALDVVNSNLVIHKSAGAFYLFNGSSISNPYQAQSPFFSAPGTNLASSQSIDQLSGIEFSFNQDAVQAYQGGYPNNISLEVLDLIQNMPGSQYAIAPGHAHANKYYLGIGNTKDKLGNTITNCILVYDFILNQWDTYSLQDMPLTFQSIVDNNGYKQLLFGTAAGQVMQMGIGTGDNGKASTAVLESQWLMWGAPDRTKSIDTYSISTSPGANMQFQYAVDFQSKWQPFTTVTGFGKSSKAPNGMRNFKALKLRILANVAIPGTFFGITLKVMVGSRRNSGRSI